MCIGATSLTRPRAGVMRGSYASYGGGRMDPLQPPSLGLQLRPGHNSRRFPSRDRGRRKGCQMADVATRIAALFDRGEYVDPDLAAAIEESEEEEEDCTKDPELAQAPTIENSNPSPAPDA